MLAAQPWDIHRRDAYRVHLDSCFVYGIAGNGDCPATAAAMIEPVEDAVAAKSLSVNGQSPPLTLRIAKTYRRYSIQIRSRALTREHADTGRTTMRSILILSLATVIGSTTAVLAQSSRDLTEQTGTEANRAKQQLGGYYGYYGGVYRSYAYVPGLHRRWHSSHRGACRCR